MKKGDLVKWHQHIGLVTEIYSSKVWRQTPSGVPESWGDIEPEPFARVLINGSLHGLPFTDLKLLKNAMTGTDDA
jgi:hypothetical protein